MKKLTIKFNDGSQVKYTMKNYIDHFVYFRRHAISSMESAILQQYPKKDNEPIDMLNGINKTCIYGQLGGLCKECKLDDKCNGKKEYI